MSTTTKKCYIIEMSVIALLKVHNFFKKINVKIQIYLLLNKLPFYEMFYFSSYMPIRTLCYKYAKRIPRTFITICQVFIYKKITYTFNWRQPLLIPNFLIKI